MELILDTNIWVAYTNKSDSQHEKARGILELIKEKVIIPEYVLVETLNVLSVKLGKKDADDFLSGILKSENIVMLWCTHELREELLSFFVSNKIEKLSFVDQSLLFLSKKYKVVTFDKVLLKHIGR